MFRRQRFWCWLALGLLGTVMSSGGVAAQEAAPAVDLYGDPLPAGSIARLGTVRYRHGGWQQSFLFAPDDKSLLSATDGGSLCWFNAADGKLIRRLDVEDRPFGTIAFAPGGRIFASAGRQRWTDKGAGAGIIGLWDFDTGKPIRTIPYGDKASPRFLVFTPDGKTLLTAGERYNSDIRIFDVASGDELLTYQLSSKGVGAMALSPDGNLVAVAEENGGSIYLWEWQKPNKPRRLAAKLERGANFLAFSPDGRMLISSGDDRRGLCFWDVARGSLLGADIVGDSSCSVRRAAFSSDGRLLATALSYHESQTETTYSSTKSGVFVWQPPTHSPDRAKEEKRGPTKLLRKIPASALDLAISADKKTLNLLTAAGPSRWDIETGKELTPPPPPAPTGEMDQVSFAPSGNVVTVGGAAIRFWEAKTGKHLHAIPITAWTSAALSPDGTRVATAAHDNTVRLFDAGSGKEIFRLPGHGELGPRYRVAFSADGKQFATFGEDRYLRVWNTANGRAIHEHLIRPASLDLPGENDHSPEADLKRRMLELRMMQAYFTPEASTLIVSVDGKHNVYDVGTGKERVKFDAEDAHNVAISPDSRWLLLSAWGRAVLGKDRKAIQAKNDNVVVYELASGKEKLRMPIPRSSAGPVAFAADSRRFAIAVQEKPARIDVHDVTGKKLQSIAGFTGRVRHLAFSEDHRLLACALDDSTVLIWDLQKVPSYKEN
jgi:WD40 repeat protein